MWGQDDYSGTYYIASVGYNVNNTTTNYYLCPTEGWAFYVADNEVTGTDNEKPFLTTYQCRNAKYHSNNASDAVWIIEKAPAPNDAYYYIKQSSTGRYIVSNGAVCTNTDRMRVHLEEVTGTPDNNALFSIYIPSKKNYFVIKPIGITDTDSDAPSGHYGKHGDHKWLVVNQGNQDNLAGTNARTDGPSGFPNTGGIICIFTESDANAPFYLEIPSPVISRDPSTLKISISCEFTTGVTIRYTTDGTEPTATSTLYEEEFTTGIGTSTVKAKAFNSSGAISSATTSFELPKNAAPSISVDMGTKKATISTTVEGGTIYYTTNGSNPTVSSSVYTTPISFTKPTTIKAIVGKVGYGPSVVTTKNIIKVGTPQFYDNGNLAIGITSATVGAKIYYTTDGTTPSRSSSLYSAPLTNMEGKTIKAFAVKADNFDSDVATFGPVSFSCAQPIIRRTGVDKFTMTCPNPKSGATIYYTTNGNTPTTSDNHVKSGEAVTFDTSQLPFTVKAISVADGFVNSSEASLYLSNDGMSGSGTSDDPYQIALDSDFSRFITKVTGGEADASFIVTSNINASGTSEITTPFTGTFDGNGCTISNLGHALFNTVNGGTVKNVMLDAVGISSGTNVGAIANEVIGTSSKKASIYSCGVLSGSVGGSGYVGSIVGKLGDSDNTNNCYARVINCFSYATISGGSSVGGIVGYNSFASASNNLRTMVMNCMFYGNITGGTNKAPIYNGLNITNVGDKGLANYNYYYSGCTFTSGIDTYNCALAADERNLTRFEFYRRMLNSNGELAAWYATGSTDNRSEMYKWILLPSSYGTEHPFPVLAPQGFYPSVVNFDAENAEDIDDDNVHRNEGRKLTNMGGTGNHKGQLAVTIQMGSGGARFSAPTGAGLKSGETFPIYLNITDKDYEHFNYNYGKVQLPYYNDYCTGNYTDNRVVTGWKIVSITGGTAGKYSTGADVTFDKDGNLTDTPYNFADRKCTNKDLYSQSGRIFSQGAYWDVPEGVTAITIEPYWGKAAYLCDKYWNVVYKTDHTASYDVTTMGVHFTDGTDYFIEGTWQKVYNSLDNAVSALSSNASHSVYDYAVVLVGNYHLVKDKASINSGTLPFTVMSADFDRDNEPDYSFILQFSSRQNTAPIRFDFINIPGLGMAQKSFGAQSMPNVGIFKPGGCFEITNTATILLGQFEYDRNARVNSPLILHGGIIEQIVSNNDGSTPLTHSQYIHMGSNVWLANFSPGIHQDRKTATKHVPVSVTGGEYEEFHLTGTYRADADIFDDNAECYIHGGKFGEITGTGLEGIGHPTNHTNGNITWLIDHADITNFFGGGINAAKPSQGNIYTEITNSNVTLFCGGPKFGDMQSGRTVTTKATDCTFGTFFGAGYGGNSYNRFTPTNKTDAVNYDWNTWVNEYYTCEYSSASDKNGISTNFDYEFIPMSGGMSTNVARLFVNYLSFSLASTGSVISTLTDCKVTGNFYGGGSLGKVNGNVTSTLTNCTLEQNAFGAGFSATLPTVEVMNLGGFTTEPEYDPDGGVYSQGVFPDTKTYTWQHAASPSIDKEKQILYTTEDLTTLGTVTGSVTLTIDGNTVADEDGKVMTVNGNVYGGGEESGVGGDTEVDVKGGTIGTGTDGTGNVFGAGKGLETDYEAALVKGNCTVEMTDGIVKGNIYGGGELSSVGTFTRADDAYHTAHPTVEVGTILYYTSGGTTTVNISGGTVGNSNEYDYNPDSRLTHTNGGNVFAGCKGVLKKSDDSYLSDWIKFARVKNTVLSVSGGRIMSNIYGGGEIGSVGYLNESGALVEGCGTSVTVSGGIIGTEIQSGSGDNATTQYTFGSVFGAGYGSDLETTTPGQTDPNAPKLFAGRVYGNTAVTMTGGEVKASVYGGGELASVSGNAAVTVSGGSVGIDKVGDKQFGGATMGNVYGGGSGNKNIVRAGQVYGNATVSISQAENKTTRIYHNIYGGGAYGSVGTFEYTTTTTDPDYPGIEKVTGISSCTSGGTATITITGGTIGADGKENGMIFGSSRGDVGAPGTRDDLVAWVNTTNVTIGTSESETGPTIKGSIYGSGENGHTLSNAAVTVHSGIIGIHDGTAADGTRGNVYGAGCGTDKYYEDPTNVADPYDGNGQLYNPKAGIVQGTATVTINGGHVLHNVYGAGAMGPVGIDGTGHKTTVNINGGRIGYDGNDNGYVFGGARGDQGIERNFAYVGDTEVNINYISTPDADNNEKTEKLIAGSVFGGGEAGSVHGAVVVNMTKGLVVNDVYGGGALADTNTDNWGTATWAEGKTSATNTTTVNLKGGKVNRNVYGGGLGQTANVESNLEDIEAKVYGNVLVELNNDAYVEDSDKGCVVLGSIFGCNNLNGTPMGDVKVHIYKTQNNDATRITNDPSAEPAVEDAKVTDRYDVAAVYGGGNQSAYVPADLEKNKTEVVIDGCERTSIRQVYGGGNAACTPATNVTVNGTFEIYELFGGGNGLDNILINGVEMPNPGANVGYKNYSEYYKEDGVWKVRDKEAYDTKEERMAPTSAIVYGTGKASVNIFGGLVHRVFGGSNTKGNVRQTALTLLDEGVACPFCVEEAYGGGKSAEMDAEAQLLMACIPGLEAVYGGAEAADVHGNVTLNITNGTFERVFGGNNLSGTINGSITVNIEEIGCKPIIIGELYGGGNQAAYSVYGYNNGKPKETGNRLYDDPQVNVTSFTSIGEIYGGGFGDKAVMVGNPTVSVNEAIGTPDTYPTTGDYDDTGFKGKTFTIDEGKDTEHTVTCPAHVKGKMGAINKVFGGGNAAQVKGNTIVNIGTTTGDIFYKEVDVEVGVTVVTSYYIRSGAGTTESPYTYAAPNEDAETCDADGKAVEGVTYYRKTEVLGADIKDNVYGGGNNAEVTGDATVNVGKRVE